MSALPEQYQRYAPPGQRPIYPTAVHQAQPVEVYNERPPIAWVTDQDNPSRSVAIDARLLQRPEPAPPRDLTPQPLIDPLAQRMAAGGIGAGAAGAGLGWGIGQAAAGIAAFSGTTALIAMLALLLIARAGRPQVHVRKEVHQHASWFSSNNAEQ